MAKLLTDAQKRVMAAVDRCGFIYRQSTESTWRTKEAHGTGLRFQYSTVWRLIESGLLRQVALDMRHPHWIRVERALFDEGLIT